MKRVEIWGSVSQAVSIIIHDFNYPMDVSRA